MRGADSVAALLTGALSAGSLATVRVTADQNVTANSATNTTLTMSLLANSNYVFYARIRATTSNGGVTASNLNFQIKALASGAALIMVHGVGEAAGLFSTTIDTTGDATAVTTNIFGTSMANGVTATTWVIELAGTITVGTTATTLEIDMLDPLATGTSTVKAGSFMVVLAVT